MTKRTGAGLLIALVLGITLPLLAHAAPESPAAELVTNGGFEAGSTGWIQSSTAGNNLIDDFWKRSGEWAAYLCGVNNTEDKLSQTLTIPSNMSARLTFWWSLRTEENGPAFDTLKVNVLNSSGGLLQTLTTLDNSLLANYAWDLQTLDLSSYAGRTIRLQFAGKSDATNVTDFWVDDVSVQTGPPYKHAYLPFAEK